METSNNALMKHLLFDIVSIVENYIGDCDIIIYNLSISINYIDLIKKLKEINKDATINEISIFCYKTFNIIEEHEGLFIKVVEINGPVKCIGNMSDMFKDCEKIVKLGDICDTSDVTNMSYMFYGATNFNQKLNWNTTNVTNMSYMFYMATNFNQELKWNTRNVKNMSYMFNYAIEFNQELNWNIHCVKNMAFMFEYAIKFNKELNWDTSNVKNMDHMFAYTNKFNQKLN